METRGKLLITEIQRGDKKQIVSAFYENGRAVELSCSPCEENQILGNIYIGKVKNIVSNIEAAFIEIGDGLITYYSLRENREPIYVTEKKKQKLACGDELLVQVSREAAGTKVPTVTCNLNFPGKYLVLTTGRRQLGLSSKLSQPEKQRLREIAAPFLTEHYGIIVRTNAAGASEEELTEELSRLSAVCMRTLTQGRHHTCFSLIYQEQPVYVAGIRSLPKDRLGEIVADDPVIFEKIHSYLKDNQPEDLEKLRFFEEAGPSLDVIYGITKALENALNTRVWLKSGAYLIIQPTEALTVIDVNTGKYSGHKKLRDTFLKINCEAAAEIAVQIRLRNLSGIIVVDFIDMEEEEDRQALMNFLSRELQKDPVKTTLVDMTPLGLAEITRKKVRKTLREQAGEGMGEV